MPYLILNLIYKCNEDMPFRKMLTLPLVLGWGTWLF